MPSHGRAEELGCTMLETIVVAVVVLGAVIWFVRWLCGKARGEGCCSCGGCGKDCAARRE